MDKQRYRCPYCGSQNVRVEPAGELLGPERVAGSYSLRVVGVCEDCQCRGGLLKAVEEKRFSLGGK